MSVEALLNLSTKMDRVFDQLERTGTIAELELQHLRVLQDLVDQEHQENLRRDLLHTAISLTQDHR